MDQAMVALTTGYQAHPSAVDDLYHAHQTPRTTSMTGSAAWK